MESNEQNKLTNKQKQTHREQTDSCQRGAALLSWVNKLKGLSKKKRKTLIDTDNSMVITIGKGGWEGRREEEVKGKNKREVNSDGRRIDLGW